MTTAFKHFDSHVMISWAQISSCFPIAPAVQAIIVDCVPIVDPQLASIIRDNAKIIMARLEDSHAACPAHSKVIASGKTRPSATCVPIIDSVPPSGHVGPAPIQVLATTTLTEVVGVLPEETMAISGAMVSTSAACPDNSPPVSSIRTMVPEEHPCVTTTFEHLEPHHIPASAHIRPGLSIAPTMQAIVVNCVSVVNPQLAPIIRDNAEVVMALLEDSQAASPAHGKVIASTETRPPSASIAVVYHMSPPSHVWSTTIQVLASATLAKVKGILSEESMAISGTMPTSTSARLHDSPSISSIRAMVPEEHASMAAALKHLQSDQMTTRSHMRS
jgi:hypothetical protein